MPSSQAYSAQSLGAEGEPIFVDSSTPITGSFYLIAFASTSQIGHLHQSNWTNLTGQSFSAGYVLGGTHTVVHLNNGTAGVYGNLAN